MIRSTKLVARYRELKTEAPGCVLLMQVGAFMQVMDSDARAVSAITGLKLQMAGDVDDPEFRMKNGGLCEELVFFASLTNARDCVEVGT
ncbi:MAG: hypothetical protein K8R59_17255 [Thermoanaerobaculales bacterium]|nr:hypothetical protein [Thermoanaerobaculales bacterium]